MAIKSAGDSIVYRNQPLANEGVLRYGTSYKLKRWDNLKQFIGKRVRIIDEHPIGRETKETLGTAILKQCPRGDKYLCFDSVDLKDGTPLKKGYSIGFIYNELPESGTYNGKEYDSVQEIVDIDHIALTNEPRNEGAIRSDVIICGDSQLADGIKVAADSYAFRGENMTGEKDTNTDILLENARLKAQKEAMDSTNALIEQMKEENRKLKEEMDSLNKTNGEIQALLKEKILKETREKVEIMTKAGFDAKELDGITPDFIEGAIAMKIKMEKHRGAQQGTPVNEGDSKKGPIKEMLRNNHRWDPAKNDWVIL